MNAIDIRGITIWERACFFLFVRCRCRLHTTPIQERAIRTPTAHIRCNSSSCQLRSFSERYCLIARKRVFVLIKCIDDNLKPYHHRCRRPIRWYSPPTQSLHDLINMRPTSPHQSSPKAPSEKQLRNGHHRPIRVRPRLAHCPMAVNATASQTPSMPTFATASFL